MSKTEREKELKSELSTMTACANLYHDELIKSRMGFDVLVGTVKPSSLSDLLAELYELREEKNERDKDSKKKSNS